MFLKRGQKIKNILSAFVICASFLFIFTAKNASAVNSTSTYDKPHSGTLEAVEWNGLLVDFVNTWLPVSLVGPVGINTTAPVDGTRLDVNGTIRATNFIGNFSGYVGIGTTTTGGIRLNIDGGTGEVLNLNGGQLGGLASVPVDIDQAVSLGYLQSNYSASSTTLWGGILNGNIWNGSNGLGNVGIGTTAPVYKLDVIGTTTVSAVRSGMGFDIYPVPDPIAPTGVVSAGGSVDTGAHWYGVTFITALGETHIVYSATQITTTAGNNTVTLTIPVSSDSRVTGRKIYRVKAGGGRWEEYLLTTIANNINTTYVDTAADSSLSGSSGIVYFKPNTTSNNITVGGIKAMTLDANATYFGIGAGGAVTTGGRSTLIGSSAGQSFTVANDNTVIGYQAANGTTGGANVIIGTYGGQFTGVSVASVNIGYHASTNSSGGSNIFIGYLSGYNSSAKTGVMNNTALGTNALQLINTNSAYNTAIGYRAGYNSVAGLTGGYNTLLGAFTGASLTTGTNNIFIGHTAGRYETGSNSLIIDSLDRTTEALGRSSALIYGVTSVTPASQKLILGGGGNVGIGSSTPNYKLSLSSTTADVINVGGGQIGGLSLTQVNDDQAVSLYYLKSNYSNTVTLASSSLWNGTINGNIYNGVVGAGNVGIGTTTPVSKLDVLGLIKMRVATSSIISDEDVVNKAYLESYLNSGVSGAGIGKYVTSTAVSYAGNNGAAGTGYTVAHGLCKAISSSYHVCSSVEMLNTVLVASSTIPTSDVWIFTGPPGYLAIANDCDGRTSNESTITYGAIWQGPTGQYPEGRGLVKHCNEAAKLACCR
ncbi:MAG: beta strand repeat-containing protein [Patescibacteria group bacterium]